MAPSDSLGTPTQRQFFLVCTSRRNKRLLQTFACNCSDYLFVSMTALWARLINVPAVHSSICALFVILAIHATLPLDSNSFARIRLSLFVKWYHSTSKLQYSWGRPDLVSRFFFDISLIIANCALCDSSRWWWQAQNDACGVILRHHELMLAAPCHQHNDGIYGPLYGRLSQRHKNLPILRRAKGKTAVGRLSIRRRRRVIQALQRTSAGSQS